jgi:diamine N-acetyltransferase
VTRENWEAIIKLDVRPDQRKFVAPPAESLAAAYIKPWDEAFDPFGIYLDDEPIGLFYISYTPGSNDNYWIGGFFIDYRYQGQGLGKEALRRILRFIPQDYPECREMKLTVEKSNSVAQNLYRSLGFADTGRVNKYDEIIYTIPADVN